MDIDQLSVSVAGPIILIGAGVISALVGVALGGAARYGIPAGWRNVGGPLLAGLAAVLFIGVLVVARSPSDSSSPMQFALPAVALWLPGFVAASLGANRWVRAGSVIVGLILPIALTHAGVIPAPVT